MVGPYIDSNLASAPDKLYSFKGTAFSLYVRNVVRFLDTMMSNKPLPSLLLSGGE